MNNDKEHKQLAMVGLVGLMTQEQLERAMEYEGEIICGHGEEFRLNNQNKHSRPKRKSKKE